jgi:hypothetical protein
LTIQMTLPLIAGIAYGEAFQEDRVTCRHFRNVRMLSTTASCIACVSSG